MLHFLLSSPRLLDWLLLVCASLMPELARAQAPPTFDMATRVLEPTGSARPYSHSVAVDAAGNSYVYGFITGPMRFGSQTITPGSNDTYIARFDADGSHRWIVLLRTGVGTGYSSTMAVDASGNLYVASEFFSASLTLGSITLTNPSGRRALFVAKLDANGNWLSAAQARGQTVSGIALDTGGNAYITGQFFESAAFGNTTLNSIGPSDLYVARLDANNTWRWAVQGGGSGDDWTAGIGVDAQGHAYIGGNMLAAGRLGSFDVAMGYYVAQLDAATGSFQRVTTVNTTNVGATPMLRFAADAKGCCYVTGTYVGRLSFGSYTLTSVGTGIPNEDVYVAKLDAGGNWEWAATAGGASLEYSTGITFDRRGNTYVSGSFQGPQGTRFGAVTLIPRNPALYLEDVFVAKLDTNGNWLWAVPAGGEQTDVNMSMALGPFATPYIVGEYRSSSMDFGSINLPGDAKLVASTYVARMQPNELRITGDSLVCNGAAVQLTVSTLALGGPISYRWSNGATTATISVTQAGLYSVTATFKGGYSLTEQFQVRSISPSLQITGNTGVLCPGTPRQLTAVAPGAQQVRWNTGATTPSISVTQPGTYTVVATYSTACSLTSQVVVQANRVGISGRLQLCPGQNTTLMATASGSAVTGYRWSNGETTPTLLVSQGGTYFVTATFADGCTQTATHTVGPPTAKVASVSGDTLLCPGTTLRLTALNTDAISYQWNTGATTPTITATQPGTYAVLLTYTGGCTSRDSLRVLPAPVAPAFTLGPDTTLCLERPLLLRAPALSGPGVAFRWSDGSSGPTLLVQDAGTYSLQVNTLCNTRTASVRVGYTSCLFIPNVITPNDDQRNDTFVIKNLTRGIGP
ncbi:hypothetical protein [Hymenobacter cellulosilyticus]|uniref:Ig-like domain-containing protein n=1 Tax=Hymenobacter cellulosilyticus TaxID=2932248 RepID=A0A8T9Q943_9BACT|nr:hypothetical protein [Hymenobacter cellulosilyticus]UOQ71493.1 hypothetical protein MUN79_23200 [Hymenobacter cellulosilyticus]